jgi:hypothetical protein
MTGEMERRKIGLRQKALYFRAVNFLIQMECRVVHCSNVLGLMPRNKKKARRRQ